MVFNAFSDQTIPSLSFAHFRFFLLFLDLIQRDRRTINKQRNAPYDFIFKGATCSVIRITKNGIELRARACFFFFRGLSGFLFGFYCVILIALVLESFFVPFNFRRRYFLSGIFGIPMMDFCSGLSFGLYFFLFFGVFLFFFIFQFFIFQFFIL